jgi:hypothetical protein
MTQETKAAWDMMPLSEHHCNTNLEFIYKLCCVLKYIFQWKEHIHTGGKNVIRPLTYACMEAGPSLKLKTSWCMNKLYVE